MAYESEAAISGEKGEASANDAEISIKHQLPPVIIMAVMPVWFWSVRVLFDIIMLIPVFTT